MTDLLSHRVAASVRAELARNKKKQRDLARVLGVSSTQAGERLAGRIPFKLDELDSVAALCGVTVGQLIGDEARSAA